MPDSDQPYEAPTIAQLDVSQGPAETAAEVVGSATF